ncbi:hypothetical protein BH09MYX1_BH09MYX1_34540 [soil metagenome]
MDKGRYLLPAETRAIAVPVCMDLKARHDKGERVFVHPSCIAPGADGLPRVTTSLAVAPTNARDRACLAPELQQSSGPGDARASVFAMGALLYELVTGNAIGPAMKRPKEIDPSIPDSFEALLAKALVGNPAHRPDDLGALASAMHHLAPKKSIPPPAADESRLDHTESFDVDIRLSMLPPSEIPPSGAMPAPAQMPETSMPGVVISAPTSARSANDPTTRLAALKERLESDPRPRYVVSKDKMDHGPFNAVELLQQIMSNSFLNEHILRDEISGQSKPIKEWEEFSQFSDQAALKREIVAEKKAITASAEQEKKAGIAKYAFGIAAVIGILAIGGVFILKAVGSRNDTVTIGDDKGGFLVDPAGSIKGAKKTVVGNGGGGGGGGGGQSYEAAWAKAEQHVDLNGGGGGSRHLSQDELGRPMQNASFIGGCGAPESMKVKVMVAVQNGRAVGVSVYSTPPNGGVQGCVAGVVRNMNWPVSPDMDSVITSY